MHNFNAILQCCVVLSAEMYLSDSATTQLFHILRFYYLTETLKTNNKIQIWGISNVNGIQGWVSCLSSRMHTPGRWVVYIFLLLYEGVP